MRTLLLVILAFVSTSCLHPKGNGNTRVLLKTTEGDIVVELYNETPLHRDNFLKLVDSRFYEGISFHRIISEFMIQAGDPSTRSDLNAEVIKSTWSYTIPAETDSRFIHKKGALAAARMGDQVNRLRNSSGTQFYIVVGKIIPTEELAIMEKNIANSQKQGIYLRNLQEETDIALKSGSAVNDADIQQKAMIRTYADFETLVPFKYTEEQKLIYSTQGGTPHLDGAYTVFGEVVEGLDIIEKISNASTDSSDKPVTPIKIVKVKIKK